MNLSKTLLATALLPMLASADQVTQTQTNEIQPDIVGGITANPNDWKFYTQIVSRNSNRSFCGASYIGDGFVLTAAHCVDGDAPNQIAVKIGGVIYNGTDGVRSNVSQIYVHPSYNASTLSNDIALLKLTSIPQGVVKVDIAAGSVSQYAGVGDWLTVAGLGRTSEGGSSPTALQEVDVPLVSDATCRQAGGNYTTVGSVSFCAGVPQGGIDSCQGDSGGPIVVNNNGLVTQLGIVSWGIGCARPGKYGVYSDIAALRSFVDGVVGTTAPPTDNVSVGYTANQALSSFKVGELKQHSFSIQNTGNVAFTVENVGLQSSGVTKSAMITRDQCAQSTLNAGSSCRVDVEFGASQAGDARVALAFGIDKTSTTYQAVATASATSATTPPSGSCDNEWQASGVYNTGETVSWAGQLWQAQWWTQGDNPSDSGPWGVWQPIGSSDCSGTNPPVEPPTEPTPPTPPTSGDAYQAGTNYSAGDVVTNNGASYQCKPWPNSLWCGSTPSAYEPGVGSAWTDAWLKL
ncbi:trypsin-like serine protease [Vibrio campbellii]|uniref:trypsin-like serine protease n=1 Tax=Vibrio campbellii TaxID=680 RepID=UPI00039D1B33|nr:trypsin-like serine protease [Vibrio campbellii]